MAKYIGYEWTNLHNDKKYLGSHIGTGDGYTCSGTLFKRNFPKRLKICGDNL